MDIENDQTKLELGSGLSEVNYIFGTYLPPVTNPPVTNPPVTNPEEPSTDLQYLAIIGGGVAAAAAGGVLVMKRKQGKSSRLFKQKLYPNQNQLVMV